MVLSQMNFVGYAPPLTGIL